MLYLIPLTIVVIYTSLRHAGYGFDKESAHYMMSPFFNDHTSYGAMIAFFSPVTGGEVGNTGIILDVGGDSPMQLEASTVINSAGLHSQKLNHQLKKFPKDKIPPWNYCKGNYYSLSGCKAPFSSLIYPAPEQAGLGVHLTLDLAGQARFGPDVEWVNEINYDVDPKRSDRALMGPIWLKKLIISMKNHKSINKNIKIVNLEILKVKTWFGDKDL